MIGTPRPPEFNYETLPREIVPGIFWLGECLALPYRDTVLHSCTSVYLIKGEDAAVIVDCGFPSDRPSIYRQLDEVLADGTPLHYTSRPTRRFRCRHAEGAIQRRRHRVRALPRGRPVRQDGQRGAPARRVRDGQRDHLLRAAVDAVRRHRALLRRLEELIAERDVQFIASTHGLPITDPSEICRRSTTACSRPRRASRRSDPAGAARPRSARQLRRRGACVGSSGRLPKLAEGDNEDDCACGRKLVRERHISRMER